MGAGQIMGPGSAMVKPGAGERPPCNAFTTAFTFYLDVPAEKAKYTLAFDAVVQPESTPEKKAAELETFG
jgi:hypothetical protein